MTAAHDDDRRHREAFVYGHSRRLTVCGLEVFPHHRPGPVACHVCLPDEAHPLEPVWAACRRWDANANARRAST